jgi:DNA-binding response OmpR family regulator
LEQTKPLILIVEDEWLLAAALEETVRAVGFSVAGPTPSLDEAAKIIGRRNVAAALLDIKLGDRTSFYVAQMLRDRNIPFLFVSGYGESDLPQKFSHYQVLRKPLLASQILPSLNALLESAMTVSERKSAV